MSSSHKDITCGRGRSTAQNSPRSIQQTFYESYQEDTGLRLSRCLDSFGGTPVPSPRRSCYSVRCDAQNDHTAPCLSPCCVYSCGRGPCLGPVDLARITP